MIAPSRAVTTTPQLAARAPSARSLPQRLFVFRSEATRLRNPNAVAPTERLREGDETGRVFQRRQLTRSNGRLKRERERELEIRCVRLARIVAHRAHQRTLFPRGLAPPPRLTAPLGLVRAGLFCSPRRT